MLQQLCIYYYYIYLFKNNNRDKLNSKHKDNSPSQSPPSTSVNSKSTSQNTTLHPSRLPPLIPLPPTILQPILQEWFTANIIINTFLYFNSQRKRKLLKPVVTPIKPPLLQTINFHNSPPLFLQKRSAYLYDSPVPSPSNKSLSTRRSRSSSNASERPKSHSLTCRDRSFNFPSLKDTETVDLKRVSMPEYIPQISARFPNFKNSNKPSARRKPRSQQQQQQGVRTPPRVYIIILYITI